MRIIHQIILLFMALSLGSINIYGVGDESTVAITKMAKLDGNYSKIRVYQNNIYLLKENSIEKVDISDPSLPLYTDEFNTTVFVSDFFIKNNNIFIYDGKKIDVIDMKNHIENELFKNVKNFYFQDDNLYLVTNKGINTFKIYEEEGFKLINTKELNTTNIKSIFVKNNDIYLSFNDGRVAKDNMELSDMIYFSKKDANLSVVGVNERHIFLRCNKGGLLILDKESMMPIKQLCNFDLKEMAFDNILYSTILNSGDFIILGDEDDDIRSYTSYHTKSDKILDILVDKEVPYEGNIYVLTSNGVEILYQHYAHISTEGCEIYEDAQNALTSKWNPIYKNNILNSKIENIYDDDKKSRVIKFSSNTLLAGYFISIKSMNIFDMDTNISWSLKSKETFHLEFEVQTDKGIKYIAYEPYNSNYLGKANYVRFGIGKINDGQWHNIIRNLQDDLNLAQKDVNIINIRNLKVYGNISLDDLKLCF